MHRLKILKFVQAFGASAQLAGRLRSAKQEDAKDGNFVAMKIVEFVHPVLVFRYAGIAAGAADQRLISQGTYSLPNRRFVQREDRVAIRFLVAGVQQCVQRERIVLRGGDFFFDEAAKYANFVFRVLQGHEEMIALDSFPPAAAFGREELAQGRRWAIVMKLPYRGSSD